MRILVFSGVKKVYDLCCRFLISFAGKYLAYDYCVASPYGRMRRESGCSFDHQLYKIHVSHTEANLFGPAFIEVILLRESSFPS